MGPIASDAAARRFSGSAGTKRTWPSRREGRGDRPLRPPVHELGSALDRHAEHLVQAGVDPPAEAIARLDERHGDALPPQPGARRQPGGAGAEDDDVR